jgi:hypothetical protein
MRPNVKMAKLVIRNPHFGFTGAKAFAGPRLKALAQDEDHKPYVRAKQNANHLPDSWDETKFIKTRKSWKYRVKKRRQWTPHWMTFREWHWLHGTWNWWHAGPGGFLSNSGEKAPTIERP